MTGNETRIAGVSQPVNELRTTNHDAERRIRREVKTRAQDMAKRLEWDTEGGAVGIYAGQEEDIRAVVGIIGELLSAAGGRERK